MESVILRKSEQLSSVAIIEINRPKALNALNRSTLEELSQVLDQIESDQAVRVVVLKGAGDKAFVAGADIANFPSLNEQTAREFAEHGQAVFSKIESLSKPVIAQVNGFALGGGLELALSCDLIVASESAKFGLPECKLGLIPGFGGTVRLPRKVGPHFALELALTGEMINASRAFEMGLINRLVPKEQLDVETIKLAGLIASRAPIALKLIKQQVVKTSHLSVIEACRIEALCFGQVFETQDAKRGVEAFLNSTSVEFRGD